MAGQDARARFVARNPEAARRCLEVQCPACGAEPDVMCFKMDGSGNPSTVLHITRLEATATKIREERVAAGLPAYAS